MTPLLSKASTMKSPATIGNTPRDTAFGTADSTVG